MAGRRFISKFQPMARGEQDSVASWNRRANAPAEGDTVGFDLLVLATELEWARDLLSRQVEESERAIPITRGFPVYDGTTPVPTEPASLPALPVEDRGLTLEQRRKYSGIIFWLWIALVIILFVTIAGAMLLPNY